MWYRLKYSDITWWKNIPEKYPSWFRQPHVIGYSMLTVGLPKTCSWRSHADCRVVTHSVYHICFYHLIQSTWRKIQYLGLAGEYRSDHTMREFCGMIDALSFLPVSHVNDVVTYLQSIAATPA
jgi:hypothetical protein